MKTGTVAYDSTPIARAQVITDADLQSVMYAGIAQPDPVWSLTSLHVMTGLHMRPTATVTLTHSRNGTSRAAAAMGTGPIDAVYQAM